MRKRRKNSTQWRNSSKFCSSKLLRKIFDMKNSNCVTKNKSKNSNVVTKNKLLLKNVVTKNTTNSERFNSWREKDGDQELPTASTTAVATPNFPAFDSTSELWSDYWFRFCTFANAHSVPNEKSAKVFLTKNNLTMEQITNYMKKQFDPKRFVVKERFRFWNEMKRRPGESIQELATHVRQAAATCDCSSITNPLDEALRFICSINNEAVLKALFKINDDKLTFYTCHRSCN